MEEIIKVDWSNRRVMTTAQVAKEYGCAPENITVNFNREKNRFKEGEHYFKLEGGALREFKKYAAKIGLAISPYAAVIYLWAEQGVLHHCKMINTPEAWQVFGKLEQLYFEAQKAFEVDNKSISSAGEAVINSQMSPARKSPSKMACAYIFDTDKNQIKIGHTGDIIARDKARDIEMRLHKKFSPHKVEGEFYSVPFEEATQLARLSANLLLGKNLF
ncbi:MAG: ORF6N domain-containing protein [Selenomonadaceae bacterium]|nr:ORF6N domain-containing protein [Selenomonadaceae bacterium]MBQ6757724.1 ORF6N domain-containing protein [Selenomonadaceae bacterium]MBR0060437.1 ORF6N domain-containing protein [Selenomonadaceae bacterium]